MTPFEVLLLIAGSGAFGGLVDGLLFPRSYRFRIGSISKDIGSFGDALVGATSSIAIFAVVGGIFAIDFAKLDNVAEFIKVVAWGVLSGFAGLRVLQPLSTKLVEEVAGQAARQVVLEEGAEARAAAVHVRDGEALLTKFDLAKSNGWITDRRAELVQFLDVAETKFDAALAENAGNPDAMRSKAKIVRRRAELARQAGHDAEWRRLMQRAIDTLSEIAERHPDYALALYNRACYRSLLDADPTAVCSDLRDAIRLNPALTEFARTDPDFAPEVRRLPEFQQLLAREAPAAVGPAGEAPAGRRRREAPRSRPPRARAGP